MVGLSKNVYRFSMSGLRLWWCLKDEVSASLVGVELEHIYIYIYTHTLFVAQLSGLRTPTNAADPSIRYWAGAVGEEFRL